jgi:hypothetical protein
MSKEKIESLINEAVGEYKSIPEAAGLIIEMLKEDYNFEFPVEFDYKKCSYNRRGDKVLFATLDKEGDVFYVYRQQRDVYAEAVGGIDGRLESTREHDNDLIMDKQ